MKATKIAWVGVILVLLTLVSVYHTASVHTGVRDAALSDEAVLVSSLRSSSSSSSRDQQQQQQSTPGVRYYDSAYAPPRPFPRWGETVEAEEAQGLELAPILDFILNSSAAAHAPKQKQQQQQQPAAGGGGGGDLKYYAPTTDHTNDVNHWFPETLYVVDNKGLWTSRRHRNITDAGKGSVRDKLVPTERMAMAAWNKLVLLQNDNDNDDTSKKKWPRLRELLLVTTTATATNNTTSNETTSSVSAGTGFPYLSWYGDYTGCNYKNFYKGGAYSIPLFTTAAAVDCNHTFPFPTYQTARDAKKDDSEWDKEVAIMADMYPWKRKLPQIVWRGSLTGKIANATHKSPRWDMAQMVTTLKRRHEQQQQHDDDKNNINNNDSNAANKNHTAAAAERRKNNNSSTPFLFDVGATRLPPRHKKWNMPHVLAEVGGLVQGIKPMADFQKYRGVLDMDGNSWSARFGALLCYNSVVLKVEPSWVDYFHYKRDSSGRPELLPWKHFIPVKADLSDLVEQASFVVDPANDEFLTNVVAEANAWCRRSMVQQSVASDILDIWERYVRLLDIANPRWNQEEQWRSAKEAIFAPDSPLDMILLSSAAG